MRATQTILQGLLGVSALLLAGASHAGITTFTDRPTFLAALQSGFFTDNFNDVTNGGISGASTVRSGNGFSVTYSTSNGNLFSTTGGMSTDQAASNLIATVSGSPTPVFAFGADFFLTDISGNFQPFVGSTVSAFASNGIDPNSTLSNPVNSATNFFGWISTTPLTSVTMNSGSGTAPIRWNTMDNVVVGQAMAPAAAPEPTTLALLGLGAGAVMFVRRRKSA